MPRPGSATIFAWNRRRCPGQLAQLRETHNRDLQSFTAQSEHHQKEFKALTSQQDEIAAERDRLAAQLEHLRASNQEIIDRLTRERDDLQLGRTDATAELSQVREDHARQVHALEARVAKLNSERSLVAIDLEKSEEAHAREIEELQRERDGLLLARNAIASDLAKLGERQKEDIEKLHTHQEELTRDRNRLSSELALLRQEHARKVEEWTREGESLTATRDELRATLDVTIKAHRRELAALRSENEAVINERDETRSLLDGDRLSWRKQIALFIQERDTLTRERDECLMAVAQERQTQSTQIELRSDECATLTSQREELLTQLDNLREAQKRQNDLFNEERKILVQERDALAARLDRALKSIGIDRTTLLEQNLDAHQRLETMEAGHRQELQAMTKERDDLVQERDAAWAQLAPFREAQEREIATLGIPVADKYERDADASAHASSGRLHLRDRVLDREVEMRLTQDGDSSDQATQDFMNEARRLGQLAHPNIPPIYDVGLDENGRPYYTSRSVSGMSLRTVLDQLAHGKTRSLLHFTLKRLLGVFHKACDAVAFAHAHGISHGALSAEHIILGDFGEVFVVRWDLRLQSSALFRGGAEIDVESDIMALGRLLYEIATLEPAPDPGGPRNDGTPAVRHAGEHGNQAHHWASESNLSTLIGVARRAMDRRMVDQFRSVKDFQIRVDAFKDTFDDPKKLTLRRLLRQWVGTHKALAIFLFAVFALAGSGFGYMVTEEVIAFHASWLERHHQ